MEEQIDRLLQRFEVFGYKAEWTGMALRVEFPNTMETLELLQHIFCVFEAFDGRVNFTVSGPQSAGDVTELYVELR